ncbi:hypothetical protein PMIN06_010241 [Paraphaeosphaeria minitans]
MMPTVTTTARVTLIGRVEATVSSKSTTWLTLFSDSTRFNGNTMSPPLQLTPFVGQYGCIGCYTEPSGKTVSMNATTSNIMTVEWCAAWCGSASTYFGLEYSQECSCGNALNPKSTLVDPSQCNYPCKGSNSEYCGGSSRISVVSSVLPTLVTTSTTTSTSTVLVNPSSSTVSASSVGSSSSTSNAVITPSTTPSSFTSSSTSQVVVVPTTIIIPTTFITPSSATSVTATIIRSISTSSLIITPDSTSSITTGSTSQVLVVPTTILSSTVSITTSSTTSITTSASLSSTIATTSSNLPSTSVITRFSLSSTYVQPTASPIPASPLSSPISAASKTCPSDLYAPDPLPTARCHWTSAQHSALGTLSLVPNTRMNATAGTVYPLPPTQPRIEGAIFLAPPIARRSVAATGVSAPTSLLHPTLATHRPSKASLRWAAMLRSPMLER